MWNYIKTNTLEPYTLPYLKRDHPGVSFPHTGPDDSWLVKHGYARLVEGVQPLPPTVGEVVEKDGYQALPDGTYAPRYVKRDKTPEELAADKAALLTLLEETRWQVEQGGITIPTSHGPLTVPTRDRDKTLISGKVLEAIVKGLPDSDTFNFVINGQNHEITIGMVKAIGVAQAEHVQRTIDVAGAIRPQIEDGTLTTPEAVTAAYHAAFNEQE